MTIQLRQEGTPLGFGSLGTTVTSNALPSNALTGSIIEVWLALGSGVSGITVTDSASQTYTLVGSVIDATDSSYIACYALNNNASATALTATANFSSTQPRNIHIREISGGKNQAPDTSNFPARFQGTNATDGLSIALTNGSNPALISGFVAAVSGSGSITAGTGFSGTTNFIGSGFSASLFETKRITANGSHPATWTDTVNGGVSWYLGGAVIWDEAAIATGRALLMNNQGGF